MGFTRKELTTIRDRAMAESQSYQKAGAVLAMRAMMVLASAANALDAMIARAEAKRSASMPQQPKPQTSAERGDITQPIEDLVGDDDLELEDDDEDEEYEVEDDGLPG